MKSIDNIEYYIHVGYAKCASTTLQKGLFDRHSELDYYGLYPTQNIGQDSKFINYSSNYLKSSLLRDFWDDIVHKPEFDSIKTLEKWQKILTQIPPRGSKIVLSNERITSYYFSFYDYYEKLNRLMILFPDAKIIFIIRDQLDVFKSQYRDHPFDPDNIKTGAPFSFSSWVRKALSNPRPICFARNLDYYNVINHYRECFGENNLLVLNFNHLFEDLNFFCESLSRFMEITDQESFKLLHSFHENQGVSRRLNLTRQIVRKLKIQWLKTIMPNILIKYSMDVLKKGRKQNISINQDTLELIRNYYRKSNNKLKQDLLFELTNSAINEK